MSLDSILRDILHTVDLSKPDGRPLYAYQPRVGQIELLGEELARYFRYQVRVDSHLAAAYCLFAAETFCRNYTGGSWAWRMVDQHLRFHPTEPHRHQIIEQGLHYWGREVLELALSRRYLGTLVCEGGLPLQMVQREGSLLRAYLGRVLREAPHTPRGIAPTVAQLEHHLPRGLRNETVRDLIVKIVSATRRFQLQAQGQENPIAYLDATAPGWRNDVPLKMDDETARHLVQGLLKERPARRGLYHSAIAARTELSIDPPQLRRHIASPDSLDGSWLKRSARVDDLPVRMRITARTATGRHIRIATAIRLAERDTYRLELSPLRTRTMVDREEVLGAVWAGLRSLDGQHIGSEFLVAEALSELPWVFRKEDEPPHSLAGLGSARLKCTHALLAVDGKSALLEGDSVNQLDGEIFGRRLFEVTGELEVLQGDDAFRVVTDAASEAGYIYALAGEPLLGLFQQVVWKGMPGMERTSDEAGVEAVDAGKLEWRDDAGQWHRSPDACVGSVWIRCVDEDQVVARRRALVMPADTLLVVAPGRDALSGSVSIAGSGISALTVEANTAYACEVQRQGSVFQLTCRCVTGDIPSCVKVEVAFGKRHVPLVLPWPGAKQGFITAGGSPVSVDTEISLTDLPRYFAVAQTRDHARFEVHAHAPSEVLPPKGRASSRVCIGRLKGDTTSGVVLPLDEIREECAALLNTVDDLDAELPIEVVRLGQSVVRRTIRIRRYPAKFTVQHDGRITTFGLEDVDRHGKRLLGAIEAKVKPLWRPDEAWDDVAQEPNGTWKFEHSSRQNGPWLMTGWIGEECFVRPTMVTVREGYHYFPTGAVERAIFSDRLERRDAFEAVMREMSETNFGTGEWKRLLSFVTATAELPASTFHILKTLIEYPDAMAQVAVELASTETFPAIYQAMEALPFSWSLLPLSSWQNAVTRLDAELESRRDQLEEIGLCADDLKRRQLRTLARHLSKQGPALSAIVQALSRSFPDVSAQTQRPPTVNPELSEVLLDHAQRDLLLRHQRDEWPQDPVESLLERAHIPKTIEQSMRPRTRRGFEGQVLAAPLVAALYSQFVATRRPWEHAILRRLRAFDEEWFDLAHATYLAQVLKWQSFEQKGRR